MKAEGKQKQRGSPTTTFDKRPDFINRTGANAGSTHLSTDVERMIRALARATSKTPEEIREEIAKVGWNKKEQFPFWNKLAEHVFDEPAKKIDLTTKGEKITENEETRKLREEYEAKLKELKTGGTGKD